ncbi:hypothetical protein ANACOL_01044 [Anaerotruncus colihominis DSM 17241]|uniref:Uncharacterized protein n=1 Tax=Anaerotruncus colihominis DSM 17241 TaxID=445972 RepID=B0P8F4_9FIRM|nr:hypothetical protein ANACOL_01044 [Anaerotruncus colihominis DSM 17241]
MADLLSGGFVLYGLALAKNYTRPISGSQFKKPERTIFDIIRHVFHSQL